MEDTVVGTLIAHLYLNKKLSDRKQNARQRKRQDGRAATIK